MSILTWNGQEIEQRDTDGYVNVTQMCRANNKELKHWLENQSSKSYIEELSAEVGMSTSELVRKVKGGIPDLQGTWAHPLVAIAIGQWISTKFHIWCNKHIKTLMETGSTALKPLSPAELIIAQGQALLALEKQAAETKAIAERADLKADTAISGLEDVRNQLASLKEFAVAQPPGLDKDLADQINLAFQTLGATLQQAQILSAPECYQRPWRDLGLALRNSSCNYDLNARYSNALKKYEDDLEAWEAVGKPRGKKPQKPTRISVLLRVDTPLPKGEGILHSQGNALQKQCLCLVLLSLQKQ